MPHRRHSLYATSKDDPQPHRRESLHVITSHRQTFFHEHHYHRESLDDNRRSSIARRRLSFSKQHLTDNSLSLQNDVSVEANSAGNSQESQGFDKFRKDATSRPKQTIFLLGDLSKLSPESASNSRSVHVLHALGESLIHPIIKIVASSSGCIAFLNDRGHVHVAGNILAIGIASSSHAGIGSGYRDISMLYSMLIILDNTGCISVQSQSASGPQPFFNKVPILGIASSDRHATLVSEAGELFTLGCAQGGALGHGREWPDESEPRLVEALKGQKVRSASCGTMFTVIIVDEYHVDIDDTLVIVYSCGIGCNGRLGHGDFDSRWIPTFINALSDPIAAISCGDSHCLALTNSGIVYSWGGNSYGQLGYQGPDSAIPKVITLEDIRITAVSAGKSHSSILTTSGIPYTFGSNRYGQLAVDKKHVFAESQAPTVASELSLVEIERIFCGCNFTVAAGCDQYSNMKINDEQLRRRLSTNDVRYQRPQLDVVDHRHERAGLDSRTDYYNYIAIDEMLAESSKLYS